MNPDKLQAYNNGLGTGELRRFETGATRNDDSEKIDFSRCLSPLAIGAFGAYMHKERNLPDGTVRAPDDWKKGIPLDSYMSSMWRHLFCIWSIHDGYSNEDKIEALCGLMFNVQGMLHETIKHQTDDVKTPPLHTSGSNGSMESPLMSYENIHHQNNVNINGGHGGGGNIER